MTLDDLKIGTVLIDRIGIKKVVFNDGYFGYISKVGIQYGLIENYFSNNLISKSSDVYDIMKIEYGGKVIWERKEIVLSDDDIAVLKALKIGFAYLTYVFLARDKNDDLYAYVNKPLKRNEAWVNYGTVSAINPNLFQFIKWEDEEPYSIEELLKLVEV